MWVGKRPEKLGQAMLTATSRRHDDGVQLWACQRCWHCQLGKCGRRHSFSQGWDDQHPFKGGQLASWQSIDYQQVWHPDQQRTEQRTVSAESLVTAASMQWGKAPHVDQH